MPTVLRVCLHRLYPPRNVRPRTRVFCIVSFGDKTYAQSYCSAEARVGRAGESVPLMQEPTLLVDAP